MSIDKAMRICSQRVLPAVYGDEISYYETLCKLTHKLNELIDAFNAMTETYATLEDLKNSQDAQDAEWQIKLDNVYNTLDTYIKSEILRIEKLIADIVAGQVTIFDPTTGITPQPVEDVVNRVYHWLRYFADYTTVIDALNMSAQQRDDMMLEAKTFDLFSMQYYSKGEYPTPAPDDVYIRKHDVLAYYFDRQSDNDISGYADARNEA